jgi:peptide-methionine (S)-S-oxide reductase
MPPPLSPYISAAIAACSSIALAAILARTASTPRPMGGAFSSVISSSSAKKAGGMAKSDTLIDGLLAEHDVVIFSKTFCPYCRAAKAAIADAGGKVAGFASPIIVELDTHEDGAAIQRSLRARTGRATVPNVFVGGSSIGGGDETVALARQGVLSQMIRAAPDSRAATSKAASGTVSGAASEAASEVVSEAAPPSVAESAPAATGITAADEALLTFGAGCFWGVELAFQRVVGVTRTEVGYANGQFTPVAYNAVCTGRTGHAEVVRVWYRPDEVSAAALIAVWEGRHDVTSMNKQGNDRGTQYRSALLWSDADGRAAAEAWNKERVSSGVKVVTQVAEEEGYSPAEAYHQRYLEKKGQSAEKGGSSKIRCYG